MTALGLAAPASLRADAERLRDAVAPTLTRVGVLEPRYADAFDLLCASALAFFSLRAAYNADVAAGRLSPDDREAEHEPGEWRRLLVRQCAGFGLLPDAPDEAPDAITVRAEERRVYRLFDLPEGWAPTHLSAKE